MERTKTYFVADVHLGLQMGDPADRERRFAAFLRGINTPDTAALYMLGDIWDFWYEWKYTVPKGYVKVFAALTELVESGVQVYFFPGNHDIWAYSYFEEMGIKKLSQPHFAEIGGKEFCLGHGDGLGGMTADYAIIHALFHNRFCQWLFSTFIHPTVAMGFGNAWSKKNRCSHAPVYQWKGEDEPLTKYCRALISQGRPVDYFVFGHFHAAVDEVLGGADSSQAGGASRLIVVDSWIGGDHYAVFDGNELKTV